MTAIREIQKKFCSRAMLSAIGVALLFMGASLESIARGLILGTLFSVINFVIMGETLTRRLGKGRGKTLAAALGSLGLRYALLALPLVLAIRLERLNLPAVVAGIFMVQFMILADRFFQGTGGLAGQQRRSD